jgi:CBS domain containing-hemolysin-like protein
MGDRILFVPGAIPAIPAFRLLELLKTSRTHMALVVDEYGDVEGLVTTNDFFEDLVGDVASADKPQGATLCSALMARG